VNTTQKVLFVKAVLVTKNLKLEQTFTTL